MRRMVREREGRGGRMGGMGLLCLVLLSVPVHAAEGGAEAATAPLSAAGGPAREGPDAVATLGAAPGEALLFNIHWMGVPGAKAEMAMAAPEPGRYALTAALDSVGLVSLLHPVHDRLRSEGWWDNGTLVAERYHKRQNEKEGDRITEFRFNREEGTVVRVVNNGSPQVIGGVSDDSNDPITAFYALRTLPGLQPGVRLALPMVDGGKRYPVEVTVGGAERLNTPLGWYDAIPVRPRFANSHLFRHDGEMIIWLSHDRRRLPLRVETSVKLGKVAADLVQYDDGRGETRSIHDPR